MQGDRLKTLREKRGWSQHYLGDRVDVSPSLIGMYERGARMPRGDILVRLAYELGVSSGYLLGMTEDPKRDENLPPEWEQVVQAAILEGLTPEDARRAFEVLRLARDRSQSEADKGPPQPDESE